MMAKKLLFKDQESFDLIINAKKPAITKNLGSEVKPFNADEWNAGAFEIVITGNYHKFSQHEALKQYLLKTGNKIIVEASTADNIWIWLVKRSYRSQ